jgi:hypothetical protein
MERTNMKTAILSSEKEADLRLLLELASKIGINARLLDDEEAEDLGLVRAIEQGRTGKYVDPDEFLGQLKA